MGVDELFKLFQSKVNLDSSKHFSISRKAMCGELVRSCGLKWGDFKFGNTKIFFRVGKLDIMEQKLKGDSEYILNCYRKLKLSQFKWRVAISIARLSVSVCKNQRLQTKSTNSSIEQNISNIDKVRSKNSSKKRKRDAITDSQYDVESCEPDSSFTQIAGICL